MSSPKHPFIQPPCMYCGKPTWIAPEEDPVCPGHLRMHDKKVEP